MASASLEGEPNEASSYENAVIWIEKAQKGSQNWVEECSCEQLQAYRLRKWLKPLTTLVKYLLLALAICEVPSWCLQDQTKCPGPGRPEILYSGVHFLHPTITNSTAIAIWIYFAWNLALRHKALGKAHTFGGWHTCGSILVFIALLDCLVGAFTTTGAFGFLPGKASTFRISRVVRPIIFLCFTKAIRDAATRVVQSIPYFADALFSLVIALFLFVWFGMIMFAKTAEGATYFQNWSSAFSALWILFTTANCPDVFLPSYKTNPGSFVFFFVYMVITIYLLSNILLAAVYDAYKEQLKKLVTTFFESQNKAMGRAFDLLANKESSVVSFSTWSSFFAVWMSGSANEDCRDHVYNLKRAKLIFDALDKDHNNGLDYEEFKVVLYALDHQQAYIPRKTGAQLLSRQNMSWVKALRTLFLKGVTLNGIHLPWDDFVDGLIAVDSFLTLMQTVYFINGTGAVNDELVRPGSRWYKLLFVLSMFFVAEVLLKVAVFGFERFWFSKPVQHRFDFLTVLGQLFLNLYFLIRSDDTWEIGLRMIVLMHVVRALRLARHVEPLRFIGNLIVRLAPTYYRMGMLLVIVFYVYGTFAEQTLGGLVYETNPDLKGSDFEAAKYWPINFNDFLSAMVTLFVLMIVNNWFVFCQGFTLVAHSKWPVIFVVSFFLVTNLIVLNILMALILDCSGALRAELEAQEAQQQRVSSCSSSYPLGEGAADDDESKYTYVEMLRRVLLDHDEQELLEHMPSTVSCVSTQGSSPLSPSGKTYGSIQQPSSAKWFTWSGPF